MSVNTEESSQNGLKSFKDVKSIEELDFSKIELIRGETPEDIMQKCLKLCREYMSGDWEIQTLDTIEVRRVTGGVTNQLYHCFITEPNPSSSTPQEVAIRLYGPKYFDSCGNGTNERLSDVIIGLIVSQNGLGPHIYGVFEDGQIQKYYKHRQYLLVDQSNEKIVTQVFQKLARIHALDVPTRRQPDWLFSHIVNTYAKAVKKFPLDKEFDEYNCKTWKENDYIAEVEWCRTAVAKSGSPVVFTHNDYRSSNIMITEPNDEVVVCDYEYSSYGYRGRDFHDLYREWGRDQFDFKLDGIPLPEESEFGPLIQIYIEECQRIYGKEWAQNPINSVGHILREAKIFLMIDFLFMALFMLSNDENDAHCAFPLPRNVSMQASDGSFKMYLDYKQMLIDQKVIQ